MNFLEYSKFCKSTALYPVIGNNWPYTIIALAGEVGELSNLLKKAIRDDEGKITNERRNQCSSELGDILWYWVMMCYELGLDPEIVLELNVKKLTKRKQENTIHDKGRKNEL